VLSPSFASGHGGAAKWTSLRPEKIGVFPPGTPVPEGHAHTDGEIKMISYQGAVTRFSVEAQDMRITAEVSAGAAPFKQDDSVRLIWPKSAMVTMEDGA
jgi:ABC-type Fe3+/spermidine/putrescine transport system ATPase subunit